MAYVGGYKKRGAGRWKKIFIIIILLHLVAVGLFLHFSKKNKEGNVTHTEPALPALAVQETPTLPRPAVSPITTPSPAVKNIISDAQAAIDAGQLIEAKTALEKVLKTTPDAKAVKLLGAVNMQLLKSPRKMQGKEYYAIQSGDYLQKIAKKYNTTVTLIKQMNGMQTDTIRLGARLLVYNGDFKIVVSKTLNTLDLMAGDKLFKRYSVGTGKFGKTPAIEFLIIDKIVEPPWTRFSDGKQIEYGDPENVLGTRWMAIKSNAHPEISGFGIHGTWQRDSIGKQSSAGCIRMLNEDVEELFDLVPRKTTVIITE